MEGSHEVLVISDKKRDDINVSLGWRAYGLIIITLINVITATQGYLLVVTIFGMASELEFGETECQVINETLARDYIGDCNITGQELCREIGRCSENSTFFLPDLCMIVYTGQGTLYDILAGPIYMIIQGLVTLPLVGLIQSVSLKPPFAIGLLTVLWTLCTLLTAFVEDYWAIALLRFLYGVFSGPCTPISFAYLTHIFPLGVHTIVFGVAQYGNLVGYGVALFFVLVDDSLGWRWCYIICGIAGFVLAGASCLMLNHEDGHHKDETKTLTPSWKQHRTSMNQIIWPFLMCIILIHTSRTANANVVSFNVTVYLAEYFPDFNVTIIGLITIIMSFPGCVFGGWIFDRLRKVAGVRSRLWLSLSLLVVGLVMSLLIFQTSLTTLVICFAVELSVFEWLYVVLLSFISDLTPLNCKLIVFAITHFFTHSIAGAVNLLVTPISSVTSLRSSLTLLCVLLAGISIVLLVICICYVRIKKIKLGHGTNEDTRKEYEEETEATEKTSLIVSSYNEHD